jgi:hypothetical protein
MKNKTQHYLIECTFDPKGSHWELFDKKPYMSYVSVKEEVWKLSQKEAEYNRSEPAQDSNIPKILGFRIIQQYIETKTEIISEFLF